MNLLDENLSPNLLQRLASLFPGLIHVRDIGLKQASDETIWDWLIIPTVEGGHFNEPGTLQLFGLSVSSSPV